MSGRAAVEALLKARKLDATVLPVDDIDAPPGPGCAESGVAWLDERLGGGWPRGETSEIVGPSSSGRSALLCATLAAAAGRGELVALMDTLDGFDPPSAAAAGLDLRRLLWVRGSSSLERRADRVPTRGDGAAAIDRALKAFSLILQAGGFGIAALDLSDVPARALMRLPFTTWWRLHRFVEHRETAALLIAGLPLGRSARGVTVRLTAAAGIVPAWRGSSHRARRLERLRLTPDILSARRLWNTGAGQTSFR